MPAFKELPVLLILLVPALFAQRDDVTQSLKIGKNWSLAVASGTAVNFFYNDTYAVAETIIEPKSIINGNTNCPRISTVARLRTCKLHRISSRKLEHMVIGLESEDLFVSTRTFPGSNSSILHWSLGSKEQIQTIFSSSVSRIKSLAFHKGILFWSECDPAFNGDSAYNGIWTLDTKPFLNEWKAVRLEGSKNINMCKIVDIVVDVQRTDIAANFYTFYWVNHSVSGKPKIQRFSRTDLNSVGEVTDVSRIKARNPHALTIAGKYLYWADNPFLMTFTINKVPLNFSTEPEIIFSGRKQRLRSLSVLSTNSDELVWTDFVTGKLWTYSGSPRELRQVRVANKPTTVVSKCSSLGNC